MKRAVGKFVRFLNMHNFIYGTVNFKESWVDQRCISDTSDDRHLCTADDVCVESPVFDHIFYTCNSFFC